MEGRVELADSVIYQKLNDEVILLNLASQQYYGLNRVGSEMWDLLLAGNPVNSVRTAMADKYGVDEVLIDTDLGLLLTSLSEAGLVRVIP